MRPRFSESIVALTDVLWGEDAFRITTEIDKDGEQLEHSLAAVGLISPPVLRPAIDGGYVIVTGFRRLFSLRRLQAATFSARLLPPETGDLTCLKLSISDNTGQRILNPGEQARAIVKLSTFFDAPEDLQRTAADLFLPANPVLVKKLQLVVTLPETVFDSYSRNLIPLAVAVRLARMDSETAKILANIFTDLRLGLNKQQELLTLIEEIAAREEKSPYRVLGEEGLCRILEEKDRDRGRRAAEMRAYLQERRFPAVAREYERFARQARALDLGKRMLLFPPRDFETTDYSLQVLFKNRVELENHSRRLSAAVHSQAMKDLFAEKEND